ncbi:MAG: type II toxin-antitoxin system RelE/ParE family toxin [Dehalococcoidia bacterium]|nr:type II toxin-antitoxin system RelE/ParE family toxin [Dehalococcoidia bacterium]
MFSQQAQGKLYRVELAPQAQRDLRGLPREAQARLVTPIQALAENPRPPGVRKLRGEERTWRIRVGPFRVVYDVYDGRALVVILKVARRSETTYRR